jgi:TRAP-type mannitol/chloroaromatic compound transport system permease small subunit
MRILSSILRAVDRISGILGRIVSYFLLVVIGVLVYEVIVRYAFDNPTIWTHELSVMLVGSMGILAGVYTLREGAHIRMDVIYNRLSPKIKAAIDIMTFFIFALFVVVLIWKGGDEAKFAVQTDQHSTSLWSPPLYPIKILLPIAAALMLLQGTASFIRNVVFFMSGKRL